MSSKKGHTKENCNQSSVFYQCDTCGTFFASKALVVLHLSTTAGHEKPGGVPDSTGWRPVPFPTPILNLDRVKEVVQVKVKDDPPQFSPPPFVPVKMAKLKFKNVSKLVDPLGQIDPEIPDTVSGIEIDEPTLPPDAPIRRPNSHLRPICAKCKLSFSSPYALRMHRLFITNCAGRAKDLERLRQRRKPVLRRCLVCRLVFQTKTQYARHLKTHPGVVDNSEMVQCDKCGHKFTQSCSLNKHLENDRCFKRPGRQPGKKTCDTCGRIFTMHCSLKRHLENDSCFQGPARRLENVGKIPCGKCGRKFIQSSSLKQHLENGSCFPVRDRGSEMAKHVCDTCGSKFTQIGSLKRHLETDSCFKRRGRLAGKKTCDKCGRTFTQNLSLKRHLKNDSCFKGSGPGPSKKKCDGCETKFPDSVSLKRHLDSGSCLKAKLISCAVGKKHCEKCGLSFTLTGNLKRHLQQENCFKGPSRAVRKACRKCGLAFAQSRSLKRHMEQDCCISPNDSLTVKAGQDVTEGDDKSMDASQDDDIAPVIVKDEEILQTEATDWSELGVTDDGEEMFDADVN